MRRELTIRCIAVGTVRTESPDGVRCELRDVSLEVNGGPAHVRIMETCGSRRAHARLHDRARWPLGPQPLRPRRPAGDRDHASAA